jgi:hypothetical protein
LHLWWKFDSHLKIPTQDRHNPLIGGAATSGFYHTLGRGGNLKPTFVLRSKKNKLQNPRRSEIMSVNTGYAKKMRTYLMKNQLTESTQKT